LQCSQFAFSPCSLHGIFYNSSVNKLFKYFLITEGFWHLGMPLLGFPASKYIILHSFTFLSCDNTGMECQILPQLAFS